MRKIIHLLGSARLALALIFILTIFLVIISIGGTDLLAAPGFATVFALVLTVFALSTAVCTWRRAVQLRKAARRDTALSNDEADKPTHQLLEKAGSLLMSRCYRVKWQKAGLLAEKHKLAAWGPIISHVGFLMVLLGFVLSLGLRSEGQFTVTEGQMFASPQMSYVGLQAGPWSARVPEFSLFLDHLTVSTYEGAALVAGELVFIEDGREVDRDAAETGVPANYRGLAFHQSLFGYTTGILIEDRESGDVLPLRLVLETLLDENAENYEGSFAVSGTPYIMEVEFFPTVGGSDQEPVLLSYAPDDPAVFITITGTGNVSTEPVFQGTVRLGENRVEGALTIRFDHYLHWLGLTVIRDPGLPVIYFGSFLITLGMMITYLIIPKKVRIRVTEDNLLDIKWHSPRFAPLLDEQTRLALEKITQVME